MRSVALWGRLRRIRLPVVVVAPAGDRVVDAHTTRMQPAGGDRPERSLRRISLPVVVVAPAGDRVVDAHTTRMQQTGGDRPERSLRRNSPPVVPVGPTRCCCRPSRRPYRRYAHHTNASQPAATDRNDPSGASDCPSSLSPQQATVPSVRTPHECEPPAATDRNDPPGASDCPSSLSPQQATVPSVRTPHECELPAATDRNDPSGASDCPKSTPRMLVPLQVTAPGEEHTTRMARFRRRQTGTFPQTPRMRC